MKRKFKCACFLHLYNGTMTTVSKRVKIVEASNEDEARIMVMEFFEEKYRSHKHLSLSNIFIHNVEII